MLYPRGLSGLEILEVPACKLVELSEIVKYIIVTRLTRSERGKRLLETKRSFSGVNGY